MIRFFPFPLKCLEVKTMLLFLSLVGIGGGNLEYSLYHTLAMRKGEVPSAISLNPESQSTIMLCSGKNCRVASA